MQTYVSGRGPDADTVSLNNSNQHIIGKRLGSDSQTQYQVKWVGYPRSQSTYEKLNNLINSIEFVKEYEETQLKLETERLAKRHKTSSNKSQQFIRIPTCCPVRSEVERQLKVLLDDKETISSIIGFFPDLRKFIVLWESGRFAVVQATYINVSFCHGLGCSFFLANLTCHNFITFFQYLPESKKQLFIDFLVRNRHHIINEERERMLAKRAVQNMLLEEKLSSSESGNTTNSRIGSGNC